MIQSEVLSADLRRMWRRRTWLLVLQCTVQGTQYLSAPSRAYAAPQYKLLRPIGTAGWQILGGVLIVISLLLAAAEARRVRTPRWFRALAFGLAGVFLGSLVTAALLNHFYVAATLILPVGLVFSELDELNLLEHRRKTSREGECG